MTPELPAAPSDASPPAALAPPSRPLRALAASLLLLLLAAALHLRTLRPDLTHVTMDTMDTLASARHLARGEFLPLRNDGAYGRIAYAPVAEWLYAPALLLGDGVEALAVATAWANLAAIGATAWLAWRLLGPEAALVAASSLALSRAAVYYARQPINTHLMTPLLVLCTLLLLRAARRGATGFRAHFAPALAFSAAAQLNASCWILALLHPAAFARRGALRPSARSLAGWLAGMLAPLSPLFASEIRGDFRVLRAFADTLAAPAIDRVRDPVSLAFIALDLPAQITDGSAPYLALFALGLASTVAFAFRGGPLALPARVLALWALLPPLYLAAVAWHLPGRYFPHYLAGALPAAALLAGAGAAALLRLALLPFPRDGTVARLARPLYLLVLPAALLIPTLDRYLASRDLFANAPPGIHTIGGLNRFAAFVETEARARASGEVILLATISPRDRGFLTPGGLVQCTALRTGPYHDDLLPLREPPWLARIRAAQGSGEPMSRFLCGFLPRADADALAMLGTVIPYAPVDPEDDAAHRFFLADLTREPEATTEAFTTRFAGRDDIAHLWPVVCFVPGQGSRRSAPPDGLPPPSSGTIAPR